jgi:hypothetical protein
MNDVPVTGKAIIDTISKALLWVDQQIESIAGPAQQPAAAPAPPGMTDAQLHHAIDSIGARLLSRHGGFLQGGFARYAALMSDPRDPVVVPATVRSHVLMMIIQASDSCGLALLGLRDHATASVLGSIRNVAEVCVYAKWLLEDPDEKVRLGRAYRLTMDEADQLRDQQRAIKQAARRSELTRQVAPLVGAAAKRMRRRVTELAQEEGVSIAGKPRRSELLEQHLPDPGGYLFYALLSNAGAHPGAGRAQAFYGRPGKAFIDVDVKGLHHVRAYWMSATIRLYLDLCELAGPVLGWPEWDALTGQTRTELQPLAEEAQHRYLGRIQEEMASAPTEADPQSTETHAPGANDKTTDRTR